MRWGEIEPVADAVLYEGYLLYPYRRSSLKNERYWGLGGLPPGGRLCAQVLLCGEGGASVELRLRFLEIETGSSTQRTVDVGPFEPGGLAASPIVQHFRFQPHLEGVVSVRAEPLEDRVWKLVAEVRNEARGGDDASALHAAHLLIGTEGGSFVSLTDPPPRYEGLARSCRNVGVWPVLGGAPGATDLLLCSPIILYDHPAVAPESPGDLFDATEVDEILTLRIRTLADEEKDELSTGDPRALELLRRAESMGPAELGRLHGAARRVAINGQPASTTIRPGDRVTLRPHRRADVIDLALANRVATVSSIEQDFEGRVQVAVTVDGDPGADLGAAGRPGHRFFFHLDEIEPLAPGGAP